MTKSAPGALRTQPSVEDPAAPTRVAASPRIRLSTLLPITVPVLVLVIAAFAQWIFVGLPALPTYHPITPETATEPYGFPT